MDRAITIVGAGHAGFQLAAALRQAGFAGALTLVGDEADLPYNRPPLSKAFLAGAADEAGLAFRPAPWFAEHRIDHRDGLRVAAIDRDRRTLRLADGSDLAYDRLVLATGARNRRLPVPGADLEGVLMLRSLEEARRVRGAMDGARRAVVVGAGFIGLEFAATAALKGLAVTVVDVAPRALSRVLSPEASSAVEAYHRALGVDLRMGAGIAALEGEGGRVARLRLSDGRAVEADLVVVGIGVVPNVELAGDAGLAIGDGIIVDETLATSDPAIFALGDCARAPNPHGAGETERLESVQNANDQARALAAHLTGATMPAVPVPWFWSDQGKVKIQMAGLAAAADAAVTAGGPAMPGAAGDPPQLTVLRFRNGRFVAAETLNRPGDHMAARALLARGAGPSPQEATAPGFELKAYAKSR
ncbi:FAD-dependent oxidoreductase [Aurantimonas sp. Leaf443]|uniref:NAD(P)/FAD-dependent oxidoreductase n=1 Tax=Aurantimonas sp. Leaf443 TaxID=1736378 RepID=UPI0009E6695A|nr:FAD-dependent oxidoreductase [Aurantimonas sp. Leaf443]